jgi:hypothetical protein
MLEDIKEQLVRSEYAFVDSKDVLWLFYQDGTIKYELVRFLEARFEHEGLTIRKARLQGLSDRFTVWILSVEP